MGEPQLLVRDMRRSEVGLRIDYFHDAADDYLRFLGVDRSLLLPRADWLAYYHEDYRRPPERRDSYPLVWELGGRVVGFSSADRISYGTEAFMHLHLLADEDRRQGLGTEFVRRSAQRYFDVFELERLFCEPNAFNTAPNRTLQRAGFRYVLTHEARPNPMNFRQVTNRWVLDHRPG